MNEQRILYIAVSFILEYPSGYKIYCDNIMDFST